MRVCRRVLSQEQHAEEAFSGHRAGRKQTLKAGETKDVGDLRAYKTGIMLAVQGSK
jgi:hypothetical protein